MEMLFDTRWWTSGQLLPFVSRVWRRSWRTLILSHARTHTHGHLCQTYGSTQAGASCHLTFINGTRGASVCTSCITNVLCHLHEVATSVWLCCRCGHTQMSGVKAIEMARAMLPSWNLYLVMKKKDFHSVIRVKSLVIQGNSNFSSTCAERMLPKT